MQNTLFYMHKLTNSSETYCNCCTRKTKHVRKKLKTS